MKKDDYGVVAGFIGLVAIIAAPFAAWFTHIIVCIKSEEWFLLIAGAIMFPVAIVHGVGIWLGVW